MREVDAVIGRHAVDPFETEVHVLDRGPFEREFEIALFGFVGVGHAVDDLFDVHLPVGHLPQVELGVGNLAAAERKAPAENAEAVT